MKERNERFSRTAQRCAIHFLARLAVTATCTSSAAAFDAGHHFTTVDSITSCTRSLKPDCAMLDRAGAYLPARRALIHHNSNS
jgi:hypothetical protein